MKRINWLELSQKLVDRFDMASIYADAQQAIGEESLLSFGMGVLPTADYPNPFNLSLSGAVLGGTSDEGIAHDPTGQLIQNLNPALAFTIPASDPILPRKDLIVLRYKLTGSNLVPKPTDPLTQVFLFLNNDCEIAIVQGVANVAPVYPAKQSSDVILAGVLVPAAATLGTQCTLDLSIRDNAPPRNTTVDLANIVMTNQTNLQQFLEAIDAILAAGSSESSDDGAVHDSAYVTCNSAGVSGDTISLAGVTYTMGVDIAVQASPSALALALARKIREDATLKPNYYAVACNERVALIARSTGAVGGALSKTGTTFSVSAASLSGNATRNWLTLPSVKLQLDQADAKLQGLDQKVSINRVYFSSSGAFTLPASAASTVFVRGCGGGGGGGAGAGASDATNSYPGGGGGGGSDAVMMSLELTPGQTYNVNIGSGGAGGIRFQNANGGDGGDGGDTTITQGMTTFLKLNGGKGGKGGNLSTYFGLGGKGGMLGADGGTSQGGGGGGPGSTKITNPGGDSKLDGRYFGGTGGDVITNFRAIGGSGGGAGGFGNGANGGNATTQSDGASADANSGAGGGGGSSNQNPGPDGGHYGGSGGSGRLEIYYFK